MSKETLCRPDESHWCVECCQGRGCCNLGALPDGKRGCLGYRGRKDLGGLPQTPFCEEVDCLIRKTPEEREKIRQDIAQIPQGEFKMGEILARMDDLLPCRGGW